MKSRILIIEDQHSKSFVTKQLLETKLRVIVDWVEPEDARDLVKKTSALSPTLIVYRPEGSVVDILELLKKKNANRRSAEVTMISIEDLGNDVCQQMKAFVLEYCDTHATAKAA